MRLQIHEFLSVYLEEVVGETQRDQRRYELTKMLMQACEELDIEKVLRAARKCSAPGPDGVTVAVLLRCSHAGRVHLWI